MKCFVLAACTAIMATASQAADLPGFDHLSVNVPHRGGAVQASIWYPAASTTYRGLIGDNPVFIGAPAMVGATLQPGKHPLILMSHGSGGNIDAMSWLAGPLAAQGALVLGLNHPGSTSGDSSPRRSILLNERTADVSALLDVILADPLFGPAIDKDQISSIGFSLGGTTVMALAGAKLNREAYASYCANPEKTPVDCAFFAKGGVDLNALPESWESDMQDKRIRKTVAIDPGMTYAFESAGLAAIDQPVQLVSLGLAGNRWMEVDLGPDGSNIVAKLAHADWQQFGPAHHFTFLPECKPDAAKLLLEEGEDPICDDPAGTDRAAIHAQILAATSEFLLP